MKKLLFMLACCLMTAATTQANGKVKINKAAGWLESAYAEWELQEGASGYAVYVKGGQYADYTKIDQPLVRHYPTYGRADAVGLKAGEYSLKVVPIVGDEELTANAAEVTGLQVKSFNRDGYAHYNATEGVGAYNNDGTLKQGARVLYVTKENAKTVTLEMQTNSKGTMETRTGIQDIIQAYEKGVETRPLVVRIIGQLKKADMPELGSSAIGLQVKGKGQNMNLTIEGIGNDATFHGFGVLCRACKYVELRNFAVMMHPEDGISFDTENEHIWGHHLDIFYGENKGGDKSKGDGSFDVKGTFYCTVSDNHFWDSGKCNLNSNGDEVDYVSYHHNWYDHSDSRHPRVRKSQHLHVFNNYYDGNSKYGVGSTTGSCIFVEKNYYRNCKYPMLISKQGSDIHNGVGSSDDIKGTFSGEAGGIIKAFDNYMTGQTSFEPYVAGDATFSKHFDAYVANSRNEQVPAEVVTLLGGTGYNNFDTAADFYTYTPDAAADVPGVVTGQYGAGRCEHGDFQYTFDNATQDKNYDVILDLSNKLKDYKTSLLGVFGEEQAQQDSNADAVFTANGSTLSFTNNQATVTLAFNDPATSVTIVVEPAENATISSVNGATGQGNEYTIAAPASGSSTTATFTITAADRKTTKTYTIIVSRGTDGPVQTGNVLLQSDNFPEGYKLDGSATVFAYTYSSDLCNDAKLIKVTAAQHTITLPYNAKVTKIVMYAVGDNNTANKGKITELAGQTFNVDLPSRKTGTSLASATVENQSITGQFTFTVTYTAGVKFELTVEENTEGINTVENVSTSKADAYDLLGRKVETMKPGSLYIQGGKKHIRK